MNTAYSWQVGRELQLSDHLALSSLEK